MPVIDPNNNPEFPHVVSTLINDSVFNLISIDTNLVAYCVGGIEPIKSKEIRELGSKSTPAIWQYLLRDEEEAQLSQTAFAVTVLSISLIDSYLKFNDSSQDRDRRVLGYIQTLLHGQLEIRDDTDLLLTDNVIGSEILDASTIEDSNYYRMELRTVFGSTIDQVTQLPIADT